MISSYSVPSKPTVTLQPSWTQIYSGETVTVRCEIQGGEGAQWTYEWRAAKLNTPPTSNEYRIIRATESDSGGYSCRGRRDYFFSEWSDIITLTVSFPSKPTVTLQPSWTQIYSGETVTVRCEIQGGEGAQWTYEWRRGQSNIPETSNEYRIIRATESDSGGYSCRGRRDYFFTEWSDIITLTVSYKPKAKLRADNTAVPVGGSVTLTCSVSPSSSSGWKYYWYRDEKSSEALTTQDAVFHSNGQISVSQEGLYRCRGGRGNPVYYTEDSQSVRIGKTGQFKVNEPQITT
ncbi:high affinity immunoglobulin gamma Fc receptor I [Maylandia zebra]|uniref:high affinity immunoglobulin gamma Fc receptor I n=1 Tax=Maylandia zebra TaxID=106582 RepID=UPI00403CF557